MRNGTARRDFSDIQIHNIVTLATRVRILILRVSPADSCYATTPVLLLLGALPALPCCNCLEDSLVILPGFAIKYTTGVIIVELLLGNR
jgi:hypothetical protein